jgi:hypothetical protein
MLSLLAIMNKCSLVKEDKQTYGREDASATPATCKYEVENEKLDRGFNVAWRWIFLTGTAPRLKHLQLALKRVKQEGF